MAQFCIAYSLYFCVTIWYNKLNTIIMGVATMKKQSSSSEAKKPFYKNWLFWVICIVFVIGAFSPRKSSSPAVNSSSTTASSSTSESSSGSAPAISEAASSTSDESSPLDDIDFTVSVLQNDTTGKWHAYLIAENIDISDYALDYYKKYFTDDDEIHAIVNFNYKTTTKISKAGGYLDIVVHEYVDKEEHDAKLLFSGPVLKHCLVNIETGEIEEV